MAGKYDHLSKEALIAQLEDRDERQPLGLVWERDPSKIGRDQNVTDQFVTLHPQPEHSCDSGPQQNLILEGDNYDALRLLRMTHAGRVKCIYIDPPYNTGNRDFIYNDRFINPEDGWRHSKWIEFMHQRLTLARHLLREDGVIFVSIDDNELFHLGMLMNQIFGEGNFVANVIWQKRISPDARIDLGPAHDYILVYCLSRDGRKLAKLPISESRKSAYKNPDNDKRGAWTSTDFTAQGFRPNQMYKIETPGGAILSPPKGRCWANIEPVFKRLCAEKRVWFGADGNGRPRMKNFKSEAKGTSSWTWWPHLEVGHNQEGKKELLALLNDDDVFSTPKPVRLIERIVRLSTGPNDIILDFFAGSGTTAHAVLKLNAEDGGNRRFILVSSTEATVDEPDKNLCRDVCARRVQRVCEGYGDTPGLGGGFAYLKMQRVEPGRLLRRLQHEQVWLALQLMHLDTVTLEAPTGTVWAAGAGKNRFIYLTQTNDRAWAALENALSDGPATLYSWQPEQVKHQFPRAAVRPIPQFLLERLGLRSS